MSNPTPRLKAHQDLVAALERLHASTGSALEAARTSARLLSDRERVGAVHGIARGPEVAAHNASLNDLLLRLPGKVMRDTHDSITAFLREEENHRL